MLRKGDQVTIKEGSRPDLLPDNYAGKKGKVLGVQNGTNNVLVKIEGKAWPVSFSQTECNKVNQNG